MTGRHASARRIRLVVIFLVLLAGFGIGLFLTLSGTLTVLLTDRYVASVEKNLSSLRDFELSIHGIPFQLDIPVHVTGYDDGGNIKKLYGRFNPDVEPGESGDRIEREYYYDRGKLLYVYERVNPVFPIGEKGAEESRFYFKDSQMVAWLFGPTKEKKPRDTDFQWQEADVLETSKDLLTAAAPRLSWVKREPIPLAQFVPGKDFYYNCEAGENGTFLPNGRLQSSVAANVEDNNRVGSWRLDGENLILAGSIISDDVYSDFTFEEKEGKIIAYVNPACGVVVGPDFKTIDGFLKTRSYAFSE
ncbi:hypothetical protein HYV22_00020 [Candidatus Gottesmanbacteria bacterium]|nr:hypothetical protein [Candidatus Gottesmanbacteria bacterium]